jgi:hypothetical protein
MDICLRSWSFKLVCSLYILMVRVVGYIAIGANISSGILVQNVKLTITMVAIERTSFICPRAYIACNRIFVLSHYLCTFAARESQMIYDISLRFSFLCTLGW